MTVASTTNRKSFSGDGVTTSFGTSPVVFYESTDLIVEVFSSTGTSTTLVENTNYTVSGGSTTGAAGTVNLAGGSSPYGAPAVGTTLLIRRVLPLVQEADFLNNDINDAEVSETALDKLTMLVQQVDEKIGRGVVIPPVETATDALTVLPFDRASQYLAFNANKEMIASPGPAGDNVPVSTFMETVLDDTSAADARTTLGAAASGAVTASGLTMATARLLGRTTASTGAVEEISIGSGLSLAAGTLTASAPASDWTLGTAVATTSGTTVDFTGLPANVAELIVMLYGVSTGGSSAFLVQLGDSGGIENTGYTAGAWQGGSGDVLAISTAGFLVNTNSTAATSYRGALRIKRFSGNKWVASGDVVRSDGAGNALGGSKELSAQLDRIRFTTVSGDTFDAGEVNILYRVA